MGKATLIVANGTIDLASYDDRTTLEDLARDLDAVRRRPGLRTASCHTCGECCGDLIPVLGVDLVPLSRALGGDVDSICRTHLALPERPDVARRREAIRTLARDAKIDLTTASLVYEYNNAEPVTFQRHASEVCMLQCDLLCRIYGRHPLACRLYLCNMGERLSVLYENIVRQGVWHSYAALGWIGEGDIAHNPFLGGATASEVRLVDFDVDVSTALESLFFYF